MQANNPEEINKVRKDIKTYETSKKIKHLSTATALLSAGLAVHGGYKGNKGMAYPALGAAFASGFARGRSRREEQAALNRIKRFYDLRNIEKRVPQEKTAVLGGFFEAISSLPHLMGMTDTPSLTHMINDNLNSLVSLPVASTVAAATPFTIDVLGLPWLAGRTTKSTRNHAYVAAKDVLGETLSPSEKKLRGWSTLARSEQMAAEKMSPEVYARVGETLGSLVGTPHPGRVYGRALGSMLKKTRQYFGGALGPWGTGGLTGETAGVALKEIDKYSPRYKNLFLNAIKDDIGVEALKSVAKKDIKTFTVAAKVLDSTIDEVPGLRGAIRSTGKSSEGFIKNVLNNPREAVYFTQDVRRAVRKGVTGSKFLLGAGVLAAAGYGLGNYHKRHPLSENKLPSEITGDKH